MQPVTLDELSQFFGKRFRSMMFFLLGDVSRN
jgi:hypothetical protein